MVSTMIFIFVLIVCRPQLLFSYPVRIMSQTLVHHQQKGIASGGLLTLAWCSGSETWVLEVSTPGLESQFCWLLVV